MCKKYELKQHNNFIKAQYKLNLLEKKILIGIACLWQKQGKYKNKIILSSQNIANIVGFTKNSYKYFEKALDNLQDVKIIIDDIENKRTIKFHIFSVAIYEKGKIIISFPEEIKPYFWNLQKHFTIYGLDNIKPLKSEYSIKLYELFIMNLNKQKKYRDVVKVIYEITEFRDLLGIEENQYKLYHQIKQRVLLPSQKELKAKTNIYFEFKEIKTGRKITSLEFTIYPNEENIKKLKELAPKISGFETNGFDKSKELKPAVLKEVEITGLNKLISSLSVEYQNMTTTVILTPYFESKGYNFIYYAIQKAKKEGKEFFKYFMWCLQNDDAVNSFMIEEKAKEQKKLEKAKKEKIVIEKKKQQKQNEKEIKKKESENNLKQISELRESLKEAFDIKKVWFLACEILFNQKPKVKVYFKDNQILDFKDDVLTIQINNSFLKISAKKCELTLESIIKKETKQKIKLTFK